MFIYQRVLFGGLGVKYVCTGRFFMIVIQYEVTWMVNSPTCGKNTHTFPTKADCFVMGHLTEMMVQWVSIRYFHMSQLRKPFQDPIPWRYLPYIRPIFQALISGNIPRKYGQKYGTFTYLQSVGS